MTYQGKMTRRAFGLSLAAFAAGSLKASADSARVALLSDLHISRNADEEYRGFKPSANLKKAVEEILTRNWDGAVLTGDLARMEGLAEDYEMLKGLLQPLAARMPLHMTLGNHDLRRNFLSAFGPQKGAQPVKDKHVTVAETAAVRLICLDSLLFTPQVPGLLGKAQRTWLDEFLRSAGQMPTVLFFHHTVDDRDDSLMDFPRLWERIRGDRNVKAVVYGHSHQWSLEEREGIHFVNLPALGYNFNESQPVGWVEAAFTQSGAELTVHAVGGNLSLNGKSFPLKWR